MNKKLLLSISLLTVSGALFANGSTTPPVDPKPGYLKIVGDFLKAVALPTWESDVADAVVEKHYVLANETAKIGSNVFRKIEGGVAVQVGSNWCPVDKNNVVNLKVTEMDSKTLKEVERNLTLDEVEKLSFPSVGKVTVENKDYFVAVDKDGNCVIQDKAETNKTLTEKVTVKGETVDAKGLRLLNEINAKRDEHTFGEKLRAARLHISQRGCNIGVGAGWVLGAVATAKAVQAYTAEEADEEVAEEVN